MARRSVVPGVYQLANPASNAYLVDGGEGLVLVDTGVPGRGPGIAQEIESVGRSAGRDLAAIAITHAHADHAGSLAQLAEAFPVPVLAGAPDAALIRTGGAPPSGVPTSLFARVLFRIIAPATLEAGRVDVEVVEGTMVPGAPGLHALLTPGHTPGHVSFFWPEHRGVLFAGDIAANVLGLRESFVHADRAEALRSLTRIAAMDFEVAVFGHGPPISGRAVAQFRRLVEEMARSGAV
jgi:glyoxylase-like metal-dependent hydrolase (beta-lactamase superfamily II)